MSRCSYRPSTLDFISALSVVPPSWPIEGGFNNVVLSKQALQYHQYWWYINFSSSSGWGPAEGKKTFFSAPDPWITIVKLNLSVGQTHVTCGPWCGGLLHRFGHTKRYNVYAKQLDNTHSDYIHVLWPLRYSETLYNLHFIFSFERSELTKFLNKLAR